MAYASREVICCDCGTPGTARISPAKDWRCIECSVARSAENARQQAAKRGPFYDAWVDGMRRAADDATVRRLVNSVDESG